jgi:NAD(P)-dependent dehydrogenase (short-subunit alcohol dehydrogenase family)
MKTVVITGSTRGIGLGLAREFLKRSHQVVVSGTSTSSVERALKQLDGLGEMIGQPCQVQDYESVQALWNKGFERFGKIDIGSTMQVYLLQKRF